MTSLNLRKIALQVGLLGLIFLYYRLHWQTLQNFVEAMDHCDRLFCDFFKVFYRMGETVFTERIPFKGFYYSPFAALLFHFLGRLPRMDALEIWGVAQLAAAVAVYLSWEPALRKKSLSFGLLYMFLLFTAFPLLHNFKWGQVSIFLTLAVFLTMGAYRSGRWLLAAFWLAFAVSIKFYPAIFLAYFVFKRDVKFLAAFAFFAGLLGVVIPAVFIGPRETVIFYLRIFETAGIRFALDGGAGALNSQYISLVVMRLLGAPGGGAWLAAIQAGALMVLCVTLALVFLTAASNLEHRLQWAFLLLFASFPFFIPTSWPHYFIHLPALQAWALFAVAGSGALQRVKRVLVIISAVLSNIVFFNIIDDRQFYVGVGFLFWSNLALMIAAWMELAPRVNIADGIKIFYSGVLTLTNRRRAMSDIKTK